MSFKPGEVDDLASLPDLNQEVLLRELKVRYERDTIYSYVGDILVAVNPFKQLPIYTTAVQEEYRNVLQKADRPPHIFAIADRAYYDMLRDKRHQCCVISGESGAGKTESAKYMIRHIIHLCHSGTTGEVLENQILQVNPLLEAFGNAATIMNDNSSRFGKYTELIFDAEGHVCGAKISDYLLEKSRVVQQQHGEQNFHIFHYIFASPFKDKYALASKDDFPYIRDERLFSDREAAHQHDIVTRALKDVGFDDNEMEMLHDVLAAILHLSRIAFSAPEEHDPASLAADSASVCARVSSLLGVDASKLQSALLTTTTITRGEAIVKPYTTMQAQDSRDAAAKELYRRMFAWIVSSINAILDPEGQAAKAQPEQRSRLAPPSADKRFIIGILDIFGFENFDVNSFEQFCINLANEQLQHFFNQHIFKMEMEEYRRENVDATDVAFIDNQPVLDMFLNRPMGLLALLDEESHFPRATDDSLVGKFHKHFSSHAAFSVPQGDACEFHIKHYAGTVMYDGIGFLDKNRDSLAPDVVHLFADSSVSVVAESFQASISSTGQIIPSRARWSSNVGKRKNKATLSNTTNKRALTVSAQFRNSLLLLVDNMAQRAYKVIAYSPDTTIEPGAFSCQRVLDTAGIRDFKLGRTKVFLKYYDAETLEVKVTRFKQLAVTFQKVARGFIARRSVVQMQREREQRAAQTVEMMKTVEASAHAIAQDREIPHMGPWTFTCDRLTIPCGQSDPDAADATDALVSMPIKMKKTQRRRRQHRTPSTSTT
ncbi:hypothetical protein PTSG_09865 [Salpingoeca rosetta]|uniref:Myosin motor domain-containing protein n=1 Tax=Salpingoeca rosetta (strain ATCC 50818 / BSB-021) TaxID=946362 RepID=F2UND0_SALR5|nr:uncharacterized protein PTSG_09865 [Salpingoeca rosetta]EGD79135.1 hypothetical protein PTSG_09865 [Salpingoeca rosetta]|eukprot:XP_004989220.1 hypothetical protein PTSG_09865 [Salpingoeca rosetta]